MRKYDDKLVDELIGIVERFNFGMGQEEGGLTLQSMKVVAAALKPKPAKFYVLPEWDDFRKGRTEEYGSVHLENGKGVIEEMEYNSLRNLTATDKPMVHFPKGREWSRDDFESIRIAWATAKGNSSRDGI